MRKHRASDVANYFLALAEQDEEYLSNLKLQKLVYYAQGIHLAMHGTPIFQDKIKAWNYGPVVPHLYRKYRKHGYEGIPSNKSFDPDIFDEGKQEFLDEIYEAFGQFSAGKLMQLTHTDKCWKDAHPNKTISHESMQKSLKKYIQNAEEES